MVRRYCTIARLARMTTSASTTIISMMVKPRLPVLVLRSIEPGPVRRRVDVEHILPAPRGRIGVVLVRSQPPFGRLHHRIDWSPAKELYLAAGDIVRRGDPLDERLEILWIAFAAGLDLERRDLA